MSDPPTASTPPYIAYVTFKNTIQGLNQEGRVPKQIDHSVLPTMSGSGRKMFIAALRFFALIDGAGTPSKNLRTLASASDPEWKEYIGDLLTTHYSGLVNELRDASPKGFRDRFAETFSGIGSSIIEPSIRFLVGAARDAGFEVSPHLVKRRVRVASAPRRRTRKEPRVASRPPATEIADERGDNKLRETLLSKFPNFDPSWDPAQQKAWFDAYQKLLEMIERTDS